MVAILAVGWIAVRDLRSSVGLASAPSVTNNWTPVFLLSANLVEPPRMQSTPDFDLNKFRWEPQPDAAARVTCDLERALASCAWLRDFQQRMLTETGTRLRDWLDHIAVPKAEGLEQAGFHHAGDVPVYVNRQGVFPKYVIAPHLDQDQCRLGIRVERLEDFLEVHQNEIVKESLFGEDTAQVRIAELELHDGGRVCIVERHGSQSMIPGAHEEASDPSQTAAMLDVFRHRLRGYDDAEASFREIADLYSHASSVVGRAHACDLFFQVERAYWQARNTASRIQYARQQDLGLGWANHDHHTYRSSRTWFRPLVMSFELMGFECRERFYAGSEAGWGAQVLEHPACGITVFADVDLLEHEVRGDFPHEGLVANERLGTVGLWCELHGDSFTSAGMHHLECQFDFAAACQQLEAVGIRAMSPFTNFAHLKQAFTVGETWEVPRDRLDQLVASQAITPADRERFVREGAIGSHLEILERNEGFKGFNQTGINQIIRDTNPTLSSCDPGR